MSSSFIRQYFDIFLNKFCSKLQLSNLTESSPPRTFILTPIIIITTLQLTLLILAQCSSILSSSVQHLHSGPNLSSPELRLQQDLQFQSPRTSFQTTSGVAQLVRPSSSAPTPISKAAARTTTSAIPRRSQVSSPEQKLKQKQRSHTSRRNYRRSISTSAISTPSAPYFGRSSFLFLF